jgi:aminopeptidase
MKADMGGAACVLASIHAASLLKLKTPISAYIPLTENMPSGSAVKPGDVVIAMNGTSIDIDNTDAEGRLILSDVIYYATKTSPDARYCVELSTLTGAIHVALGSAFNGIFTKHDELWQLLEKAGKTSGDLFWRMPMDDVYLKDIKSNVADLRNVGAPGSGAGSSTAAIFLQQFVDKDYKGGFAHIDIAGSMHGKDVGMDSPGMTGRPTRGLIQFLKGLQD